MAQPAGPRCSREEVAERGDAIYERDVLPTVGPGDEGKYAAIDIVTGAFEIDERDIVATQRLRARHPEAQIWLRRIGSRYARRFAAHGRAASA